MAESGVRMHSAGQSERPLDWTDPSFTFNTSCHSCHVSQLKTNYDLVSDTYNTVWREPGINCETCHGNADAHVAVFANNKGELVKDMRIVRATQFTVQQRNEMCAPCHAKMSPVSPAYQVQQRFFDHYDLVTLEDDDYYPDGRDRGENYTYTSWLMSPRVRSEKLDCMHCHTSSGRYKFASQNRNGACLPCHEQKVARLDEHSHHGARVACVDCHMPKTRFANMVRSDHSMLPPASAATVRFQSPNACNLCHQDKDARWADTFVRRWHKKDYQRPVLQRAQIIESARRGDWTKLPAILGLLGRPDTNPVIKSSILRLLAACNDPAKWPAVGKALQDHSPLVRSAAAASIAGAVPANLRDALVRAAGDDFRLVRIRAGAALANVPDDSLSADDREVLRRAEKELIAAYTARPDDFASHTNLGNYYLARGDTGRSIQSFETALRLRPDSVGTLVNAAIAYSRAGRIADAEKQLHAALQTDQENPPRFSI